MAANVSIVDPNLKSHLCLLFQINGSDSKEDVFVQIDGVLTKLLEQRKETSESLAA